MGRAAGADIGPARDEKAAIGFVVDFVGPALRKMPRMARVDAVVSAGDNGKVLDLLLERYGIERF